MLNIGIYASFATGNLQATLSDYRNRFPDVEVYTVDGNRERLIAALERRDIDVAIMTNVASGWKDRTLSLWTERVIAAVPTQHELSKSSFVQWRDIVHHEVVLPLQGPGAELESLLAAKLNGERPRRILHQETGLDRLLSLVGSGYGVLLMLEGGSGYKHEGMVYRAIQDGTEPTRLNFCAYWIDAGQNPALKPFLDLLRERFPDLAAEIRDDWA